MLIMDMKIKHTYIIAAAAAATAQSLWRRVTDSVDPIELSIICCCQITHEHSPWRVPKTLMIVTLCFMLDATLPSSIDSVFQLL